MWGFGQHTSLGIVVGLCGASGNTLLILGIVVGLCASGNSLLGLQCYWFMWGLGQHTHTQGIVGLCGTSDRATHLTGYCWFMWGIVGLCGVLLLAMLHLGQHTLLGIVVGLREASANTLYWVGLLLWVMRRFGQHTSKLGLMWAAMGSPPRRGRFAPKAQDW
jgi:hypothetical protein